MRDRVSRTLSMSQEFPSIARSPPGLLDSKAHARRGSQLQDSLTSTSELLQAKAFSFLANNYLLCHVVKVLLELKYGGDTCIPVANS